RRSSDLTDHDERARRARRKLEPLHERELEVAVAVGEGRSNADIASRLFLSVPTVKTHVSNILTKLESNNRVQVALLVHDAQLLDEEEGKRRNRITQEDGSKESAIRFRRAW